MYFLKGHRYYIRHKVNFLVSPSELVMVLCVLKFSCLILCVAMKITQVGKNNHVSIGLIKEWSMGCGLQELFHKRRVLGPRPFHQAFFLEVLNTC